MVLFVVILGGLIISIGLACFIRPRLFQRLLAAVGQGRRIYWISLLRLGAGVGLLAIAMHLTGATLLLILGNLFLLSGLIGLALGPRRLQPMVEWWASRSAMTIRLWALLAMGIGGALIYAILRQCPSLWAC